MHLHCFQRNFTEGYLSKKKKSCLLSDLFFTVLWAGVPSIGKCAKTSHLNKGCSRMQNRVWDLRKNDDSASLPFTYKILCNIFSQWSKYFIKWNAIFLVQVELFTVKGVLTVWLLWVSLALVLVWEPGYFCGSKMIFFFNAFKERPLLSTRFLVHWSQLCWMTGPLGHYKNALLFFFLC